MSDMAWPPEAARFMMVAVTMIGSSIAIRQLDHVGITLVVDALPRNLALGLYVFVNILVALFLVIFIWYSAKLTFQMGPRQISSSLGLNMAYAYISMPIGGLMMLIQVVAAVIEGFQRNHSGHSPFAASPAQTAI